MMRTNIHIKDHFSAREIEAQGAIRNLRGKVEWEGDLEASRPRRTFDLAVEYRNRPCKKSEP